MSIVLYYLHCIVNLILMVFTAWAANVVDTATRTAKKMCGSNLSITTRIQAVCLIIEPEKIRPVLHNRLQALSSTGGV